MSSTLAANVAIFVSGIIIPVLLLGLLGALAKRTKQEASSSNNHLSLWVSGLAVASLLAFLVADLLWLTSILQAYPSEATITSTQLAYVTNTWWAQHYGEGYTVTYGGGDDGSCLAYQFPLASVTVQCPRKTCETELLLWSQKNRWLWYRYKKLGVPPYGEQGCSFREICLEDCQAYNAQYQCSIDDYEDDGQCTEDDLLEAAQDEFPTSLSMVTDCTSCRSLTRSDYEWVMEYEGYDIKSAWRKPTTTRLVGGLLGLLLGGLAWFLHHQQTILEYCDKACDKAWNDEHDFSQFEE